MEFLENLPQTWQEKWQANQFTKPSAIQQLGYKPIYEGKNAILYSPTGSGKTLAYALPLMEQVQSNGQLQLIVLLPAQEVAMQVTEVIQSWGESINLTVQQLIGGANIKRQLDQLKKKPEIIIGTPGRIFELIQRKKLKTTAVKALVLDEADLLLGNKEEVNATQNILQHLYKTTQLIGVSATDPQKIVQGFKDFNREALVIDATKEDSSTQNLQHFYLVTPSKKRTDVLRRLSHVPDFQGLVFFNQVNELQFAEKKLAYEQVPSAGLNADENKLLRKKAMEQFKQKQIKLLLTTDVAARGLDFVNLPFVIQYEPANTPKIYTHRAGRTGRMGASGAVITLIGTEQLAAFLREMKRMDISANEIFLHGGKLVDHLPELSDAEKKELTKRANKKTKSTNKNKTKVNSAQSRRKNQQIKNNTSSENPNKRKKNRARNQKNKGMRKQSHS